MKVIKVTSKRNYKHRLGFEIHKDVTYFGIQCSLKYYNGTTYESITITDNNKNIRKFQLDDFYETFYTDKELRKAKIKNINGRNLQTS